MADSASSSPLPCHRTANGCLYEGDVLETVPRLEGRTFQTIIADPPYFQVLEGEDWDNKWDTERAYLDWTLKWVEACSRRLAPDGLFYIFGQPGKREHAWIRLCAELVDLLAFHDLIVWDRVVGYNERRDSFTPQFEMILSLKHPGTRKVYFNKDEVRIPYDEPTIQRYLKDKRYGDRNAREAHLRKGKYATNILRVPSLKGASREKVGHPSQKPVSLIEKLVLSSSRPGDTILDPFLGSGTTALVAESHQRRWVGIETNPEYARMTLDRIGQSPETGE